MKDINILTLFGISIESLEKYEQVDNNDESIEISIDFHIIFMKRGFYMKGCAIAFNIVGMICTIIVFIFNMPIANKLGLTWLYVLLLILCIVFGATALITLADNKKSIFVGVMCLLFNGLVGGILYLCWTPYSTAVGSGGYYSANRNINNRNRISTFPKQNTTLEEKANLLKKYKDLLDNGCINQEEFDSIKQQILNDKETKGTHSAYLSSRTIAPEFSVSPYRKYLKELRAGAMLVAGCSLIKGDLRIVKGASYRYVDHYAYTYQIVVDGKMCNLSEKEFVNIFFKKS